MSPSKSGTPAKVLDISTEDVCDDFEDDWGVDDIEEVWHYNDKHFICTHMFSSYLFTQLCTIYQCLPLYFATYTIFGQIQLLTRIILCN